jgi:hypothetical protein
VIGSSLEERVQRIRAGHASPAKGNGWHQFKGFLKRVRSANPRLAQAGAESLVESADEAYAAIRASTSDVAEIAQSTGFKPRNLQTIKDHLFYREHLLDRYVDYGIPAEMARFDSDAAIAAAWQRLRTGTHTASDIALLKHEMAESTLMRRWGDPSYTRAHNAARARYPWNPPQE